MKQKKVNKQENGSFIAFDNKQVGLLYDDSKNPDFPIRYYNFVDDYGFTPKKDCSYYIYAYQEAPAIMSEKFGTILLHEGMYASVSGNEFVLTGYGKAIIIEVLQTKSAHYLATKFSAMFNVGGPLEETGRLKYIDGCTDSLLIPPVKWGDPCLNHLHFPNDIDQTAHTHPSNRIGIVSSGHGLCKTPFGNLPLKKDMIFIIKYWDGETYERGFDGKMYPTGQHSFETFDSNMDVVAFHPDSDFGATDLEHPMINRTIVEGKSASEFENIRTK